MINTKIRSWAVLALIMSIFLTSCATGDAAFGKMGEKEKVGTVAGAATGAAIGGYLGKRFGGDLGAVAGVLIGGTIGGYLAQLRHLNLESPISPVC